MPYSEAEKRREYNRELKARQRKAAKTQALSTHIEPTSTDYEPKATALEPIQQKPSPELIAYRRQITREYEGNHLPKNPEVDCYKGAGKCLIREDAKSHFECVNEPDTCLLLAEVK